MDTAGISKKIDEDLASAVKNVEGVSELYEKAVKGAISYDEAGRFASMLGEEIGGVIFRRISENFPDGGVPPDAIMAVIPQALRNSHSFVTRVIRAAQEYINKKAGLGINALVPEFDANRAEGIAKTVAEAKVFSEVENTLPQLTEAFSRHVVDQSIMINAAAHNSLGLETTVIREYSDVGLHKKGDDCDFCLERVGTWTYREAKANDVFRRHKGCKCKITYETKRSTQVQTDWTQNKWKDVGKRR